jgi:hypothetical protein
VLRILVHAESVMFMAIAVALVVIAVVVFARGGHDLVLAPRGEQFAVTITRAVSSALCRGGGRAVRRAGSSTPVRPAGPGLSGRR